MKPERQNTLVELLEAWEERIRGKYLLKNKTGLTECIYPVHPVILSEKHA